jgi:MFS family permease
LAGYLADRIGRVRVMQLTILLFSLGSLLAAFAQDPLQLTIYRGLLGLGFGGEAAVAAVALSEAVGARHRGRAMGFYASSYAVGWGTAVVLQAVIFTYFPAEIAWRLLLAVGALPALLIFYIRRSVEESALQTAVMRRPDKPSLLAIFAPANIGSTITGALLTIGAQGGFYSLMVWMPQFLRAERKISIIGSTPYLLCVISGAFVGYATGGWLADRYGRKFVFMASAVCAGSLAYVYTHVPFSNSLMLVLGFPLGFCVRLLFCHSAFLERGVSDGGTRLGSGFTYNAGRAIGGGFRFLSALFPP